MLSVVVFSLFLAGKSVKTKPPKVAPSPPLELVSLCEEDENQFRWRVENKTDKAKHFLLSADDRAGYRFHGHIPPQASIFVITYRKLKQNRGADSWTLKAASFSQTVERNRDSCQGSNDPTPPPPPPPPVVEVTPPHPCLAEEDALQFMEPLTAYVRVFTSLGDNFNTFSFQQDIQFTLQTCELLSVSGRFTQNGLRNNFALDSQLSLGAQFELGATRIALLADDGSVLSESQCTTESCFLQPFLVKDLQGNFGLAAQSKFFIVVDYNIDGALVQKAIVFTTH